MSIVAKIIIILIAIVAGFMAGVRWHAGQDAIKEVEKNRVLLSSINRGIERQQARDQAIANSQGKKDAEIARIAAERDAAIDELRNRPTKRADPAETRPTDVGATGADLSMPDASFLVREAARADGLRARLAQCQRDFDALTK